MKGKVATLVASAAALLGVGVLAFGAYGQSGQPSTLSAGPDREALAIFGELGVDPEAVSSLDLSGYRVWDISGRGSEVVVIEGLVGDKPTAGLGCATGSSRAANVCASIRSDGLPSIAVGRASGDIQLVRAEYPGGQEASADVAGGIFVLEGPPAASAGMAGELPVTIHAIDGAGREVESGGGSVGE